VILADEQIIRNEFNNGDYVYQFEGQSGKSKIKSMYLQIGEYYKEMGHGVKLLNKIRLHRAAQKSASVQSFLKDCGLPCWWF
jgi:hypothetical protein